MDVSAIFDSVRGSPAVRGVVAGLVMFAMMRAYASRASLSDRGLTILGVAATLVAAAGIALSASQLIANFLILRDWDFLCFWTYGRALALNKSPYDVEVLREIAAPLGPTPEFLEINVCLYPPICLPLFWPLGYLPFTASMGCWFAVQLLALIASVVILRQLLDPQRTWLGLIVTLAMVFASHATQLTLLYGQTNFLFLLSILGLALARSSVLRGAALGVGIIIKPIAAILLMDVVLRRQWRTLVAVLAPPAVALAVFLLLQGWPGWMRYVNRAPEDISFAYYNSFFNQSALGVLLRWFQSPPLDKPILFPPYLVLAGALTAVTVLVVARVPEAFGNLRIGYVLLLALLVYPGTQMYYSVWLLAPLAFIWKDREALYAGQWMAPLTVALAFGLGWSRWNFAAHFVVWLIFTVLLSNLRQLAPNNLRG